MVKRICGYLMVVILTCYWFFLYDKSSASWLLALEIIYPVFSFLYLRNVTKKTEASLVQIQAMGEKKTPVRIGVQVKNKSMFHHAGYRLQISVKNGFSGRTMSKWITGVTDGAAETISWYEFISNECGSMEISLQKLRVYDFLGIFVRTIRQNQIAKVAIWPEFALIPVEISRRTREFLAEADDFSTEKSGEDPSEIYQIREYQEQDSVHKIHWKLSAKEDDLMIKESGFPLGCVVLLWIDFSETGADGVKFGQLVETVASLSMTLAEEKCIHMAAWFEEKNKQVVKQKIDGEEAVYELIQRLILQEPCLEKEAARQYYEDSFRGSTFSSTVEIRGRDAILVNGQKQDLLQL
ncbi:MAG: DUF58 domain-containing protein [Hespellia sp.]|nr:DUF58 domain-containing protein [Hespellia sp.]